jgi:hypothetical protein
MKFYAGQLIPLIALSRKMRWLNITMTSFLQNDIERELRA